MAFENIYEVAHGDGMNEEGEGKGKMKQDAQVAGWSVVIYTTKQEPQEK